MQKLRWFIYLTVKAYKTDRPNIIANNIVIEKLVVAAFNEVN